MGIKEAIDLVKDEMRLVDECYLDYLNSDAGYIKEVVEYILKSGGKRYRPMLLLLTTRLFNYSGDRHIPLASVVEFIHTSTLLHDDVVDNADLRRGKSSVNSVWGNDVSVLIGDYLLARAFSLSVEDGDNRVLRVLADTTTRMAEGEVMQLMNHNDTKTTEEAYLEVITNKTALLFSASCKIAAIVGDASDEGVEALGNYGLDLGIAFQLTDDCLDYVSSDETLGKPVGNDLREGKLTLPLIRALKRATPDEKTRIKEVVEAKDLSEAELQEIFAIIKSYGGIEYTLERARERVESAKKKLEIFEPNIERTALMAIADSIVERSF